MNSSGPKVMLPDCETARACLLRRLAFHHGNARAFWMPPEFKARHADRATDTAKALDIFASYEEPPTP